MKRGAGRAGKGGKNEGEVVRIAGKHIQHCPWLALVIMKQFEQNSGNRYLESEMLVQVYSSLTKRKSLSTMKILSV